MPIYIKSLSNSPPAIILLIEKLLLYPCEFSDICCGFNYRNGNILCCCFQQAIKEMGYLLGCLFYA